MDLDTIGAALRRKLGPLPVWVWAILGGGVLYYLRSRGMIGSLVPGDGQSGQTLQPQQRTESTTEPQPTTTLQPGESAYDPNTGTLHTAPGGSSEESNDGSGGGGGSGNANDPSEAIDHLANSIAGGFTVHMKQDRTKAAKHATKPGSHGKKPSKVSKRTPGKKNAHAQHPGGSTKPTGGHGKPGQHKPSTSHKPARDRSSTTIRTPTGGRTRGKTNKTPSSHTPANVPHPGAQGGALHPAGKVAAPKTPKSRTPTAAAKSPVRARPTVPLVTRSTPVQHPASTSASKAKTVTHAAPRPSSPAPRTTRAVASTPARAPARAPAPRAAAPPPPPPKKAPPPPPKKKK